MRTEIVLFTRNLRLRDNPALAAAARDADEVVPLFVFDPALLKGRQASANRLAFLLQSLEDLDRSLGGRLVTRSGDSVAETLEVVREVRAAAIHLSADYSAYAKRRENGLRRAAGEMGIELHLHPGCGVVEPGALVPNGRDHFAVFTPYLRRWLQAPWRPLADLPRGLSFGPPLRSDRRPPSPAGVSPGLPAGGETPGHARLERWLADGLERYAGLADDLAADATSRLSPYLHLGCVSPLETARRALATGGPGALTFARQLCWRDFHLQVLAARSDLPATDYRARGDRWRHDPIAFERWRQGRTGVPIVDAAMRQLLSEGWIANRARLVAASYLVKDLYLDWRLGADHFNEFSSTATSPAIRGTGNGSPGRATTPGRTASSTPSGRPSGSTLQVNTFAGTCPTSARRATPNRSSTTRRPLPASGWPEPAGASRQGRPHRLPKARRSDPELGCERGPGRDHVMAEAGDQGMGDGHVHPGHESQPVRRQLGREQRDREHHRAPAVRGQNSIRPAAAGLLPPHSSSIWLM